MRTQSRFLKKIFPAIPIFFGFCVISAPGLADEMSMQIGIKGKNEALRTKTEFLSLRGGGGNYGGYGLFTFATVRWNYFYFDAVRIFGGGGAPSDRGARQYFGGIGIGIGFPWHLDSNGIHEIRIGTGIESGIVSQYNYCEESDEDDFLPQTTCYYRQQGFGLIFTPEVYYVWHANPSFALQVGVDLSLATYANKIADDPPGADRIEFQYPAPAFNAFIGFRL